MAHVFIAFNQEDSDFAELLLSELDHEGIEYWVHTRHIVIGEAWSQAIDDAIKNSYALILVASPNALASEYVTYEWTYAMALGIPIIPIQVKSTFLHPRLQATQYLDFSDRSHRNWEYLFSRLRELKAQSPNIQQLVSTAEKLSAFLSYSRADKVTMQRIKADLELRNIDVWTDEELEPGTQSWITAVESAIESTLCIIVMLSPNAKKSRWVREELSYAENQNKPIIPILVSGDERDAVPLGFTLAQRIDIRGENIYQLGLEKLIATIKKHHITHL